MASRQIMFFATAKDISSVLIDLERNESVKYAETGMFDASIPKIYNSHTHIRDLGKAMHPTAVANPCYLVSMASAEINIRPVPQKKGGVLFAVDQLKNPESIAFRPGGKFGSDVILYGMIGTVSQSAVSKSLFMLATKALRQSFTRQEEFLIGPEARELWNNGVRLTIGATSPPEFDLRH